MFYCLFNVDVLHNYFWVACRYHVLQTNWFVAVHNIFLSIIQNIFGKIYVLFGITFLNVLKADFYAPVSLYFRANKEINYSFWTLLYHRLKQWFFLRVGIFKAEIWTDDILISTNYYYPVYWSPLVNVDFFEVTPIPHFLFITRFFFCKILHHQEQLRHKGWFSYNILFIYFFSIKKYIAWDNCWSYWWCNRILE